MTGSFGLASFAREPSDCMSSRSFYAFMLDDLFTPSNEPMSEIWRHLPEELHRNVLLHLPAASQSRYQAVCKSWQRTLSCEAFKKQTAAIAFESGRYICGFVHSHALKHGDYLTDLEVHYKVQKLSLEFLPRSFCKFPQDADYQTRWLLYTGGLIMLGFSKRSCEHEPNCERLWACPERCQHLRTYVINAFNKTWREVPMLRMDAGSVPRITMEVDQDDAGGFLLLVYDDCIERRGGGLQIDWVYYSLADAWIRCRPTPEPECNTLPRFERAQAYNKYVVRGETLVIPQLLNRFEVWGLHSSGQHWELLSFFPEDMMAKIRNPAGDYKEGFESSDLEVEENDQVKDRAVHSPEQQLRTFNAPCVYIVFSKTQLAGDVIFFTIESGFRESQVIAYHVVQRSWQIVFCDVPEEDSDSESESDDEDSHMDGEDRGQVSWQRVLRESDCSGLGMDFLQPRLGLVM